MFKILVVITFLHFSTISLAHFHNIHDSHADITVCKICKLSVKIFLNNTIFDTFEKNVVSKRYIFVQNLNLKTSFLNHINIRAPPLNFNL